MSSITPNGSLDALGISLEDWASLSDEEQSKKIKDLIAGQSETQIEKTLSEIADDFKAEKGDLKDLKKELKRQLHSSSPLTDKEKAQVEDYIAIIDEIAGELEDYKTLSITASKNVKKHNFDVTDGSEINVSQASITLDGETYVYKLGSAPNPFGDDGTDPRLDGVTSDGTRTGTVLKDMNGDLKKDDGDINFVLIDDPDGRKDKQKVFISPPPGQHWSLVPDSSTNTYTFKVTNEDGEFSFVTFENAAEAVFTFSGGINESDMEYIKSTWPTELLKNSYWKSDDKSFYSKFNLEEPATEGNTSVIPGYQKAKTKLNEVDAYTDGVLNNDLKQKAQTALDTLYAFYDNPGDKTLQDVWNGIFASWAGVSEADQANMIQHLAAAIGFSDKDDLQVLFTPAASLIEQKLSAAGEPSAGSKALILALALLKDPSGKFTDGYFAQMNPKVDEEAEYIAGTWTNHGDNIKALDLLEQMAAQTDVDTFVIGKYRPGEESFGVTNTTYTPSPSLNGEEVQAFMDEGMQLVRFWRVKEYGNNTNIFRTDWTNANTAKTDAFREFGHILTNDVLSPKEKMEAVMAEINKLDKKYQDDVAYAFLSSLATSAPATFNTLLYGEGMDSIRNSLRLLVTDGSINGQRSYEEKRMTEHAVNLLNEPLPTYTDGIPALSDEAAKNMRQSIIDQAKAKGTHDVAANALVDILENEDGLTQEQLVNRIFEEMTKIELKYRDDVYFWFTKVLFAYDPSMFQTVFHSEFSTELRSQTLSTVVSGNIFGYSAEGQAHDKAFIQYLLADRAPTNIYTYVEREHAVVTAQPLQS